MALVIKKAAAEIVGKSRQTIYRDIKSGKLPVENISGVEFIDTDELNRVYGIENSGEPTKEVEKSGDTYELNMMTLKYESLQAEYEMFKKMTQARIEELEKDRDRWYALATK